jgi:hypothetical protein
MNRGSAKAQGSARRVGAGRPPPLTFKMYGLALSWTMRMEEGRLIGSEVRILRSSDTT